MLLQEIKMSRELKFRVPCKCQNGHFRWAYITFDSIWGFNETRLGWGERNCNCPTGELGEGYAPCEERQQFTGRFDKNNKELYENDIFTVTGSKNKRVCRWFKSGWYAFIGAEYHNYASLDNYLDKEIEIVGNIDDIRWAYDKWLTAANKETI
jgi:hypothetical protein